MIKIGVCYADPHTCSISRDQEQIKLPPRAMDVLCFLAEHAGQVVSAETLLDEFWASPSASDHAVHKTIVTLRRALGDSSQDPAYLKTFPKRGYALIAEVVDLGDTPAMPGSGNPAEAQLLSPGAVSHSRKPSPAPVVQQFLIGTAILLVGLVGVLFWLTQPTDSALTADESTVIEIPTMTVSGGSADNEHSYIAHGIRTAVAASLAKLPNVRVINRPTESEQPADQESSAPLLEPDHILTTDLVSVGNSVKVIVKLINSDTSEIEYSDQLATSTINVLSMQNEIVDSVANALRVVLDKSQMQAMHDWGTSDALAYDHLMKAEFYKEQWNQRDWERAISHYQEAIAIDPRFVNAYTGLATVANYLSVYSRQEQTGQLLTMLAEYQRQLELMLPDSSAVDLLKSMTLNIEGINHAVLEKRYREQILSGQAPAYVFAQYGLLLQGARFYEEAAQFLNLAASSDPYRTDPNQQSNFLTGALTPWDAIAVKKEQLVDQPRHIGMIGTLIDSLAITGNLDAARYYLVRQQDADWDGIRLHLSKIHLAAMTGELERQRLLRSANNSLAAKFELEFPELAAPESLADPDLQLNNGIMELINGDIAGAAAYWRNIPAADTRRLVTRLHASEKFFPATLLDSEEYADLLEVMGTGVSWQRQLMEGVIAMRDTTGIDLHPVSRDYLNRGDFMARNNAWSAQDWLDLQALRESQTYVVPGRETATPP